MKSDLKRIFSLSLVGGLILCVLGFGVFVLWGVSGEVAGSQTPFTWQPQEEEYFLDEIVDLYRGSSFNGVFVISAKGPHGPCNRVGEIDLQSADQLFSSLSGTYSDETASLDDFIVNDVEIFQYTDHDVIGVKDQHTPLIIIGGPVVNLGYFYYNYHKPLRFSFFPTFHRIMNQETDEVYYWYSYNGQEGLVRIGGVGPSKPVDDYAVIQLFNDDSRPVLLIAGFSGVATKAACQYLASMITGNETLPHKNGIVLNVQWRYQHSYKVEQILEVNVLNGD